MFLGAGDFDGYGVLIGVAGLAVSVVTMRYNSSTRRVDKREKEMEAVITASLNKFRIEFFKELEHAFLDSNSVVRIKVEVMDEVSERYVQRETWEQYKHGMEETIRGIDHRIKRNSQNIYMATDNMFDIMSHVGMRRKSPSRVVEDDRPDPSDVA